MLLKLEPSWIVYRTVFPPPVLDDVRDKSHGTNIFFDWIRDISDSDNWNRIIISNSHFSSIVIRNPLYKELERYLMVQRQPLLYHHSQLGHSLTIGIDNVAVVLPLVKSNSAN